MRQDQFEKLQLLTEKLTDAFIREADPDAWPGAGISLANMDQATRGNAYWCKKNAAATLSVIVRTTNLIGIIQLRGAGGGGVPVAEQDAEESSLDADMKAAEKEATKLLAHLQGGMKKKVHGK